MLSSAGLDCAAGSDDLAGIDEIRAEELVTDGPGVITGLELEVAEDLEAVFVPDDKYPV